MKPALLLNMSYEPLSIIPWHKAVTLLFLEKVDVVEQWDLDIRSVSLTIKAPSVIRLKRYVKRHRNRPPLTKFNLMYRDHSECQYCGIRLTKHSATFDHVIPRSKGGKTCWSNVVLACEKCNKKKGSMSPKEAGMKLRQKPQAPNTVPILHHSDPSRIPQSWKMFISP